MPDAAYPSLVPLRSRPVPGGRPTTSGSMPTSNDLTGSLATFTPATRAWFSAAFTAPTPAQDHAWAAISAGQHTLVIAPTGSGKTLAAFLHAIDQLF
ncbi:MAG TPA: hypothetical protein DCX91_05635, partial [Stenotrophomonas sp.]|nr:hypothetical protein [Stenotrophomonas sp.]